MITLMFLNLIIGISAFLLNYRILKFTNFIDSLFSLFILYFTQIVFTELLLGILGILFIQNVILINLAILLIICSITRNKESFFGFIDTKDLLSKLLNNKVILFAVTVIIVSASVKIFINLINPPFGWDNLNYHFTFPVEWLKHANLSNPITICDDPGPSYYPINGNLFYLWLMLPLKNVFLADLGQIPFFVLTFLGIYNISRKLEVNRTPSFYAAALFFIIPNFFKQLSIAYVDVMVTGLFLVSLNYLFLLNKELSLKNALLYSMSMGLLLGIKTISLPYSALLFLPFVFLFWKNINKPRSFYSEEKLQSKKGWGKYYLFIISILIIIALGGFSYIRNFIETGNPLYPLDFSAEGGSASSGKLFGQIIFKGVIDNNTYRAHFKIEDYSLAKLLFHEGLGVQSLIFILPSLFLGLPVTWIKKRKIGDFNLIYFLILPFLIYLIYRYVIPLANTRYLYPLLSTGIIIGFYLVEILNIPQRIISILVFICTLTSISELAKRRELITSIILTFLAFFLLPPLIKYIRQKWTIKKYLFICLFSVFIVSILILLEKDYIKNEYPRYIKTVKYSGFWPDATTAWDWLNRNTTGNNIAYVGRPVPFPLYGTNFKNNVYYVSVNRTEPAKLHYFPNSHYHWGYDFLSLHRNLEAEGNYRSDADYSVWLNNLIKRNTDYLFIYSLHQTKDIIFPLEDSWVKANTAKFSPVFTNETIHIYKIVGSR